MIMKTDGDISKIFGVVVTLVFALIILSSATAHAAVANLTSNSTTNSSITNSTSNTTTNSSASLWCGCVPSIVASPSFQVKGVGKSVTIYGNVTKYGCGCQPDTYQWYNDTTGTPVIIPGATSLIFTETANATGQFKYYITINASGDVNQSNMAVLRVHPESCGCGNSTTVSTTSVPTTTVNTTTIQSYGGNNAFTGGLPPQNTTTIAHTTTTIVPITTSLPTTTIHVTEPKVIPATGGNDYSNVVETTSIIPVTILSQNTGKGLNMPVMIIDGFLWVLVGVCTSLVVIFAFLLSKVIGSKGKKGKRSK
jgi:hypothetical protein